MQAKATHLETLRQAFVEIHNYFSNHTLAQRLIRKLVTPSPSLNFLFFISFFLIIAVRVSPYAACFTSGGAMF